MTTREENVDRITLAIGRRFRTFGGGQTSEFNPLVNALIHEPFQFAAGVDVRAVVEFVLNERQSERDEYGEDS